MKQWTIGRIGIVAAATLVAIGGCAQEQPGQYKTVQGSSGPLGRVRIDAPAKAEAPKPAAKAEAPKAEAPKPAASGNVVYYPSGRREDAVLMMERMYPSEVVAGQTFGYNLKVTNLSGVTVDNVMVDELLPSNFNFTGATPTAERQGDVLSFNLGRMAPGASQLITVNGSAGKTGQIASCANLTYTLPICQTINVIQPALTVNKVATPQAMLCDAITYKITVTNSGTGLAKHVRVLDSLPAGVTTSDGKSALDLDAGDLAAGQSKDFTVSVKASKTGTYQNFAEAVAEGGLKAKSATVSTVVTQPVLSIKANCSGNTLIGRNSTCTFTVKNTGDAAAADVVVTAPVSAGSTFVSADNAGAATGGSVSWNVGRLNAGESKTVSMTVKNAGAGTIVCSASAKATCASPVQDQCQITVQGVPDIGTGIDDDNGVVMVGENHVFHYKVRNQGQVDLTNVTVVAETDAGLDFVSTTWSGGAQNAAGKLTWKVGTLKVGQEVKFDIVCKGSKEGQLVIRTTTTSDQTANVRNDEQVHYIK